MANVVVKGLLLHLHGVQNVFHREEQRGGERDEVYISGVSFFLLNALENSFTKIACNCLVSGYGITYYCTNIGD